jgi:hypothetical protein
VHYPFDRAVRGVADRVVIFRKLMIELCNIGNELPSDGVVGIAAIDQLRQSVWDRDRIARGHRLKRRLPLRCHQTARAKLRGAT